MEKRYELTPIECINSMSSWSIESRSILPMSSSWWIDMNLHLNNITGIDFHCTAIIQSILLWYYLHLGERSSSSLPCNDDSDHLRYHHCSHPQFYLRPLRIWGTQMKNGKQLVRTEISPDRKSVAMQVMMLHLAYVRIRPNCWGLCYPPNSRLQSE
jgi:hypothetical protein